MRFTCELNGQKFTSRFNLIFIVFFSKPRSMQNDKQRAQVAHETSRKELQPSIRVINESVGHQTHKIQIVISKKKAPIISLESSQQVEKPKEAIGQQLKKQNVQVEKTKKIKKLNNKCQICKQQGKKNQMKACTSCKGMSHLVCIGFDHFGEVPKKFICQKCHHDKLQDLKTQKKMPKKDPDQKQLQFDKTTNKKMEREKKKEEHNKKLNEFFQRYPYYNQQGKVRLPIEDKLLFIYRQLFQINQTNRIVPSPHPIIPSQLLGDLLQIENFFSTFRDEIVEVQGQIDSRKNVIYFTMNCSGPDEKFTVMLGSLLRIYLRDVLERNKTDNVKSLNENCFFTLLSNLNQSEELTTQFLAKISREIIRFLSTIPSMKKSFQAFEYPNKFNLNTKIQMICSLIKGLSEVDEFHQLVSRRSDKIQQMTKERGDLIAKLKKDEAEALSNKEKMREITNAEQDKSQNQSQQQNSKAKQKQSDKNKKKLQKLNNQKEKSQQIIKDFKSRIAYISKSISFMTTEILFLGLDRNTSEYYLFIHEPNRIYVRYKEYLLSNQSFFGIYENKQKILEFSKTLCLKGIQQKHLYENIQALIKDGVIRNLTQEEQELALNIAQPVPQTNEDWLQSISFQGTIKMMQEMEGSFSAYLLTRDCQWGGQTIRTEIMAALKYCTDLHQLKIILKKLQEHFLFVEHIPDRPKALIQNSDEEIQALEVMQNRKKVAIRIWGINSQKIRKFWLQYLEDCVDITGLWICTFIFKIYVDKYIKRKIEHQLQEQKKNAKLLKQRQKQHRLRKRADQQKYANFQSSQRQRSRQKKVNNNLDYSSDERYSALNLRKSARLNTRRLNMDSDIQPSQSSSLSDDMCALCGQYGQMICCDTCPKVFHTDCLKIKQVPQGAWSCFQCLQRLANERQTRSKSKKMGR